MLHVLHVIQIIEVLLYIEALHVKALHFKANIVWIFLKNKRPFRETYGLHSMHRPEDMNLAKS
jgi:hypothetical protein